MKWSFLRFVGIACLAALLCAPAAFAQDDDGDDPPRPGDDDSGKGKDGPSDQPKEDDSGKKKHRGPGTDERRSRSPQHPRRLDTPPPPAPPIPGLPF